MRIVAAPQEYKGTLTAREAAEALAAGARRAAPGAEIDVVPMSDGGPGLVDALVAATGGRIVGTPVRDPLGRPVEAGWGLLPDGTAVIEMAAAAGLVLLSLEQRDPRVTTTYGVGELVRAVLDAGCRRIIVGVGGSATNDGGAGMASALGVRFLDSRGRDLPPGGVALARLGRIDTSRLDGRLRECRVTVAADVTNPLCGPEGASLVYGPQKGATPEAARELDAALRRYGEVIELELGASVLDVPGAGAAGGLGAGLIAFLRADVRPGFDVVAEATRLRELLAGADLVLTGEGRLDGQTLYGKTVAGVARFASEASLPVIVVPGELGPGWEAILSLVAAVEPVAGGVDGGPAAELLALAAERAVREWREREGVSTAPAR